MIVYVVRNIVNLKVYVGYTTTALSKRYGSHVCEAQRGTVSKLYNAMREIGIANFYIQPLIVGVADVETLKRLETEKIIELDAIENGYNELSRQEDVGDRYRGKSVPDHVKKALHEGQMKRIAEQGGPNLGRKFSDEWRENISLGKRGIPNLKKRKLTNEQRRLILSDSRPLRHVAKDYGVSHKTILRIKREG